MNKRLLTIGVLSAALLAGCAAPRLGAAPTPTVPPPAATAVSTAPRGTIMAQARVVPARKAALNVPAGGIVTELLVAEGQAVEAGQPLLRLAPERPAAEVEQAQADLARAEAHFASLRTGPTEGDIAVAQAQLRKAQAQQQQTRGSVTSSDVRAAEERLQQAKTALAELGQSGRGEDVAQAEARVQQQQAALATERTRLSAAKTDARLKMDQAVDALTSAQSAYVLASKNWQTVEESGKHPVQGYRLAEAERRTFYDAFVQATAALKSAESAVESARVAYDAAREAETTDVQAAEQRVAEAVAALSAERGNTDRDDLAAARADVATAQAELDRLRGDERGGALAVADAAVAEAEAELARLRAPATATQLAEAEAEVQRAQAALKLAQVGAAEAELRAPFAGTVSALDLNVGEYAAPGTPVLQLADLSSLQVETTDLTELNIVRVREGSPATISFDAIPSLDLSGTVAHIRALGENKQGDITYTVVIELGQQDSRLRWNMTASVAIEEGEAEPE